MSSPKEFYELSSSRYFFNKTDIEMYNRCEEDINEHINLINTTTKDDVITNELHSQILTNKDFNIETLLINKSDILRLFKYLTQFTFIAYKNVQDSDIKKAKVILLIILYKNNLYKKIIEKFIEYKLNILLLTAFIDYTLIEQSYIQYYYSVIHKYDNSELYKSDLLKYTHPYAYKTRDILLFMFDTIKNTDNYYLYMFLINFRHINNYIFDDCRSFIKEYNSEILDVIDQFGSVINFKNNLYQYHMDSKRNYVSLYFFEKKLLVNEFFDHLQDCISKLNNDYEINKDINDIFHKDEKLIENMRLVSNEILTKLLYNQHNVDLDIKNILLGLQPYIAIYVTDIYDKDLNKLYSETNNIVYKLLNDFMYVYLDIIKFYKLYLDMDDGMYLNVMANVYRHLANFTKFINDMPLSLCINSIDHLIFELTLVIIYGKKLINPPIDDDLFVLNRLLTNKICVENMIKVFKKILNEKYLDIFIEILKSKNVILWKLSKINNKYKDIVQLYFYELDTVTEVFKSWDDEVEQIRLEQIKSEKIMEKLVKDEIKEKRKKEKKKIQQKQTKNIFEYQEEKSKSEEQQIEEKSKSEEQNIFYVSPAAKQISSPVSNIKYEKIKNLIMFNTTDVDTLIRKFKQQQLKISLKHPVHIEDTPYKQIYGHCPAKESKTIIDTMAMSSDQQLIDCYCDRIKRQTAFKNQKMEIEFEIQKMINSIDDLIENINNEELSEKIIIKNTNILNNNKKMLIDFKQENQSMYKAHEYPIKAIYNLLQQRNIDIPKCE